MTLHSVADELFPLLVPEGGIVVDIGLNLVQQTVLVLEIKLLQLLHVFEGHLAGFVLKVKLGLHLGFNLLA
jgi:hypothetical protein